MINITTPNNSNTFFVKADGADYIQCPVAEAEGIAVLRYIPVGADSVEGEYYANGTALKRMLPTTITFTAIGITHIDIFTKKHSDSTWLQVGKSLDASTGLAEFRLLPSDFVVGDIIDIKVEDCDNSSVYDEVHGVVIDSGKTYLITDDDKYLIDDDNNKLII